MLKSKKIVFLFFGKIPPPLGGVTISIKNLKLGLESLGHYVQLISLVDLLKIQKFDIGHIHYSKKYKVILAILLSKILCKKTILTKHGANFYPQNSLLDKVILNLSDGIIVLNEEVFKRCQEKENSIKLPPIFNEGVEREKKDKKEYFYKEEGYSYLLLYASGKVYIDNQEVYGVTFVLQLLEKFSNNIKVILLDPSGQYSLDLKNYETKNLIYLNQYVNFNHLVSKVDIYLRPTTSDGNSVATLEALTHGIPVIASDIVERTLGVICYTTGDKKAFMEKIYDVLQNKKKYSEFRLESISHYIKFCNKVLY